MNSSSNCKVIRIGLCCHRHQDLYSSKVLSLILFPTGHLFKFYSDFVHPQIIQLKGLSLSKKLQDLNGNDVYHKVLLLKESVRLNFLWGRGVVDSSERCLK